VEYDVGRTKFWDKNENRHDACLLASSGSANVVARVGCVDVFGNV